MTDYTPPPTEPTPPSASVNDQAVQEARGTAWLSYLGILWIVPLLVLQQNAFAKFHVKQGIVITLAWLAVWFVGSIIPVLGWFVVVPVGSVILIVLSIMGIIKALNGEYWKAPLGVGDLATKWFKF